MWLTIRIIPMLKKISVCPLIFFLISCAVGPNYVRAPVVVPKQFKEAKGKSVIVPPKKHWKLAEPRDDIDRGEWWKIFGDKTLNELEDKLNLCNQSIVNAEANYRQAMAIVDEARSNYYPTLTGTFNLIRQTVGNGTTSFSSTSAQGTTTGTATTGGLNRTIATITTYAYYLNANWEPDVWGQVRRTVESDLAAAQASAALWAVTRLSSQGSLAQYYFQLQALDRDQKLLDSIVEGNKTLLRLTRHQYASGVASQADIVAAQSQLEVAEAQAINNGILRGQYEHAIAVLIGIPPAEFYLPFIPLKTTPPAIPIAIPTAWLERRPDVAQAERQMQEANALIGVAISAYFPSLNLAGSRSGSANSLHRLIHTPAIGWSLGLVAAETIFDGGLRNATVRAARAGYDAEVATYRQTVLAAFQDVEDSLIALRVLEKQGVVQNQAVKSAKRALAIVVNQYKSGTVDYASVVTSQLVAYSAEKNAADVVGLQMTSAVGLIKALGGGWNAGLLNSPNSGVKS